MAKLDNVSIQQPFNVPQALTIIFEYLRNHDFQTEGEGSTFLKADGTTLSTGQQSFAAGLKSDTYAEYTLGAGLTMSNLLNYPLSAAVSAAGTNSQGSSTLLTSVINNVTTAAANSGVRLPVGIAGMSYIWIMNNGANAVQVFPSTGTKIDAGSANASITMAVGEKRLFHFVSTSTGWFSNIFSASADSAFVHIAGIETITGAKTFSSDSTFGNIIINGSATVGTFFLPAFATGTATGTVQGDAFAIATSFIRFTTVAANTGGRLPATGGLIEVENGGVSALKVYPDSGNTIDGGSANAAVTLAVGEKRLFLAYATGWQSAFFAKGADSTYVHTTATESIAGAKTFSTQIIVPNAPTGTSDAINQVYLATRAGQGTLSSGTVTITNAAVTTGAVILTSYVSGTLTGFLKSTAGSGNFTISSANLVTDALVGTDSALFNYFIASF